MPTPPGLTRAQANRSYAPAKRDFDVVVVGGSEVGVLTAVAAARQGASVLILSESERLGGVTGWSLTQTDMLNDRSPGMIFGLAREFFKRVGAQRSQAEGVFERFHRLGGNGKPSQWTRALLEQLATTPHVQVMYSAPLTAVTKTGTTITSITAGGIAYTGRVFIEATPTGELVRQAGLSTSLGREAASLYSETGSHLGIQTASALTGVDPYVTAGNSGSGLIFGVDAGAAGTVGAADGRVMASGIRTYITNGSDKIAWPDPASYDATKYEVLARIWAASPTYYNDTTAAAALNKTFLLYDVSLATDGSAYDLNHRLFATAYPIQADWLTYIDGTPAQKATVAAAARNYFLGLVKFILTSNDARVPANLKSAFQTWGPSGQELTQYGGVSPQVYVREGRRLVGDYVLPNTASNLLTAVTDAVAWGAYGFDCKDARMFNQSGVVAVEGAFSDSASGSTAGFPIPYKVLTPKVAECTNLLSPAQPSVSRYVWTAVRAIPVLLTLAHVAGVAAALAAKQGITVQNVAPTDIRTYTEVLAPKGAIIIGTGFSGGVRSGASDWNVVGSANQRWPGNSLLTARAAASGNTNPAVFSPNIYEAGQHRVFFTYQAMPAGDTLGRATNTTVTITHGDGTSTRTINQGYPGAGGGWLEDLGTFWFAAGSPSAHNVAISGQTANGSVIDGVVILVPLR